MTKPNARFAIDLDEIERQLMQAPHQPAPAKDPLAELARIVGQDDPFRATADDRMRPQADAPADDGLFGPAHATGPDLPGALPPRPARSEPSFEHMVAGAAQAHGGAYDPYRALDHDGADHVVHYDEQLLERPRPRRAPLVVSAVVAVAALGIGSTLAYKAFFGATTGPGGPPIIQADNTPLKVQPQNPGGVDIPNQNKQIYERAADGKTQVVNREEQPVDVQQAARALPAAPQPAVQAPQTTGSLTATLGEPKRVRTVSIKPDAGQPVSDAAPTRSLGAPGMTSAASAPLVPPVATPPRPRVEAPAPVAAPATPPAAATRTPVVASAVTPPAPPAAPPVSARPLRVASADAAAPVASEPAPVPTATGGFVVQLSVRPTEKEAQTAFKQLQQRFSSELGSRAPIIRKAEVNGSTIYRVRVGPFGKSDADSLCTKLQAAGGQCFVAKN